MENDFSYYRIQLKHKSCFEAIKLELGSGGIFKVKQGLLEECDSPSKWERGAQKKDALYFIARDLDDEDETIIRLKVYNSQRRSILAQIDRLVQS